MLANFRALPASPLTGPTLLDPLGMPRFWAAVWSSFLPADLAESTIRGKLNHVEALYQHTDEILGLGRFDDALASCDLSLLGSALESYFISIRNRSKITAACEDRWQAALQFVIETVQRVSLTNLNRNVADELRGRLTRLELLYANLHIGRRRRPEQVRSLPSEVIEYLYETLDPESTTNPFKSTRTRWRIYVLFILMLHQGLRRGESLALSADAIKEGFDRTIQQSRFWITVKYNEYEDDPRASKPSIKTALSIRQIPVSRPIALTVQEYISNHRGRTNHSFLFDSQMRKPLSIPGVSKAFATISASLPNGLRKNLEAHTGADSIRPHDLRHTCAVMRLNQFLSSGMEMQDALQRLRVFFGWSRDSEMPLRYARAVFEDRLASVWRAEFDDRVSFLKSLPQRHL